MKNVSINTLFELNFIANPVISPDGKYTAFTQSKADPKKNLYTSVIRLMDNDTHAVRQLTAGGSESAFIWEDAHTLLFPAQRSEEDKPKDGKLKTAFYRIDINGGEAVRAFEVPGIVTNIVPADGKYALTCMVDLNRPAEKPAEDDWAYLDYEDYHVVEEAPLWGNGRGFVSRIRSSLYVFDPATAEYKKLTEDLFDVSGLDVKDKKALVTGRAFDSLTGITEEVREYDLNDGSFKTVIPDGKWMIRGARYTDGGILTVMTEGKKWGSGENCAFFRIKDGELLKIEKDEDFHIGPDILCDVAYGMGKPIAVNGDSVYFIGIEKGRQELYLLDGEDKITRLTSMESNLMMLDEKDGSLVFVCAGTNEMPGLYEWKDGAPVKTYDANADVLAGYELPLPERLTFTDPNGDEVEGWVLRPVGFEAGKKYPGVLEIHGGPRCMFGTNFFHELHCLAGAGYFVLFCNPHGSEGYGEAFADLRGQYGDIDFKDLMGFVDKAFETYPELDAKHLGASGGSYGGFMCNWIEGNTDRFAAIASQRSISNWVADFGASEIGISFDKNETGADPWSDMEKMWAQSPLKYACNAKTPILFIHSLQDYNCPVDQGVEMFSAMKYFGVPSRMCLFEGENHSLSRSGKPRHRARRLTEILNWFDKYLKDQGDTQNA